ncbi:MAG TPA: PEP-CTERM sorting domain-containing protein [Armatimonadota bacterium]|jgi:hypothetical protein
MVQRNMARILTACGALAATALLSLPALAGSIEVGVGYADGLRPDPGTAFPTPWQGDPGVLFLGGGNAFDAGVICFTNVGTTNVILDQGLKVDGFQNGATFQIWDALIGAGGLTIAPGQTAIATQTTEYDFDSSDQTNGTETSPDTFKPVIHASYDGGQAFTYTDTAQVLNTGGFDLALKINPVTGQGTNESLRCRPIGTTGIDDPFGKVPEPSSLALLTGALPLFGFLRKKRA